MLAISSLLGSTGDMLVGDISVTDGHSKAGHATLPEFPYECRYVVGDNFQ